MNPTPVAWMDRYGNKYSMLRRGWKEEELIALFTAAQLRQARADALREAAEVFNDPKDSWIRNTLANMAAELEVWK